ncbi:hypothetical protein HPP92_002460 [Vanilla planifolia]|uniref:Uncharacterized protein n=1 Tax=Vanilla planifolia TaxID=51239 RepID=A0A835VMI6_VANPL|nr:hypothetical protein HPP92_002460 [Vanilla planifolia]
MEKHSGQEESFMGEENKQKHQHGWELFDSSSISEDCYGSMFSEDDASSSSSPFSSSSSSSFDSFDGPLYEMSSLMASLPIKRGLSKFFEGKSQSFTCLSEARSIQDLAKKERSKACKRSVMEHKTCFAPNAGSRVISKKASRNYSSSVLSRRRSSGVFLNL